MTKTKIVNVKLSDIDSNPKRSGKVRIIEALVESLIGSIESSGFWEGVIGRKVGDRVQIAFGHHRIEAAKRYGLKSVPIIIKELSDKDMVRFFINENLAEFNSDFYTQLEGWDTMRKELELVPPKGGKLSTMDIAKAIGGPDWVRSKKKSDGDPDSESYGKEYPNTTKLAEACAYASKTIREGLHDPKCYEGLTVSQARQNIAAERKIVADEEKKTGKAATPTLRKLAAKTAELIAEEVRGGSKLSKDQEAAVRKEIQKRRTNKEVAPPDLEKLTSKVAASLYDILSGDENDRKTQNILDIIAWLSKGYDLSKEETDNVDKLIMSLDSLAARAERLAEDLRGRQMKDITPTTELIAQAVEEISA